MFVCRYQVRKQVCSALEHMPIPWTSQSLWMDIMMGWPGSDASYCSQGREWVPRRRGNPIVDIWVQDSHPLSVWWAYRTITSMHSLIITVPCSAKTLSHTPSERSNLMSHPVTTSSSNAWLFMTQQPVTNHFQNTQWISVGISQWRQKKINT